MYDGWENRRLKNLREKSIGNMLRETRRRIRKTKDWMCADERREGYKGMRGDKLYKLEISEGCGVRIWVPNHRSKILEL